MKTNSKTLAKVGLYGAGGICLGYPALNFVGNLWKGWSLEDSATGAVFQASGYNMKDGSLNQTQTRNAAMRTIIGAGLVYAGRKV